MLRLRTPAHPSLRPAARAALLACACAFPLSGSGQAQQDGSARVERVEVTGSRIKRIDSESASALQLITREDIERSGAQTANDVLRNLAAGNAGGYSTEGVPDQSFGGSGISLRGLGAGSTLVLVNGRRVAPFGYGAASFVDTNAIPAEAIERIETLLDGASAIYGADAIAGVVNIILRKNFKGVVASAAAGQTAYHDGDTRRLALNIGFGDLDQDGYNVFATLSHASAEPVLANARPRTHSADFRSLGLADRRSSYYRGLYEAAGTTGGAFIGNLPGCTPLHDPSAPNLDGRCINDNTDKVAIATQHRNDALYTAGTWRLGELELFGDLSVTRTRYWAPGFSYGSNAYGAYTHDLRDVEGAFGNPAGGDISVLLLPVGHPQNPLADRPAMVRYLFNDVKRTTEATTDNQRLTLGLRAPAWGWDTEAAAMYSRSHDSTVFMGLIQDAVLVNEVLDERGYVRPGFLLGQPQANDPALMARLYPTMDNTALTTTSSVDLRASREWLALPGGRIGVAIGAELRRETFSATPDPLMTSGAIQLFSVPAVGGSRRMGAVYGELVAPVLKGLELSLAGRIDRYSDFGSASTPKVGVKWRPLPQLALRSTYSEGFRAPSLPEMNASRVTAYTVVQDPKFCPIYKEDDPVCQRYVQYESGNNPDLRAEKSHSLTAGFVLEPSRDLSLAVDAYRIKRRDEITSMDTAYLLNHESDYPQYVVRNPITGLIDKLFLLTSNLAGTQVRGFDADLKAAVAVPELGRLNLNATYNRMQSYKAAPNPGAPEVEYAGSYLYPKERFSVGLHWSREAWKAGITWQHTGGYSLLSRPTDNCAYTSTHPDYCRIKPWTTADLYLGWTGLPNVELGLTVQNVDNREAPLDVGYIGYLTGFNSAYHNQLGRVVQLSAKARFK